MTTTTMIITIHADVCLDPDHGPSDECVSILDLPGTDVAVTMTGHPGHPPTIAVDGPVSDLDEAELAALASLLDEAALLGTTW